MNKPVGNDPQSFSIKGSYSVLRKLGKSEEEDALSGI